MPGTSTTGSSHAAGFTLLELLVVIAIVTLTAMALPVALERSLPGRRVAATADRLVGMLRDAQTESTRCSCIVHIELRDRTIKASPGSRAGASYHRFGLPIPETTQVVLSDVDGHRIDGIDLFPDGSADGAQFDVVDGRHRRVVTVSVLTGRIRSSEMT